METFREVVIVGAGAVGTAIALALDRAGISCALIDARSTAELRGRGRDERALALAPASQRILDGLGLWSALAPHSCPIEHIHVSQAGHFGSCRLSAREEGVSALGHVVGADVIGAVLAEALERLPSGTCLMPERIVSIDHEGALIRVTLEGAGVVAARLLIGADGASSFVRETCGIGAEHRDFGHTAVLARVRMSRPAEGWAFERFTDAGPVAFLPRGGCEGTVVWTVAKDDAGSLLALDEAAFARAFEDRFGLRLGPVVQVGARQPWPLAGVRAKRLTGVRVALAGNAANTLHPVAAQGMNLGLRDAALLVEGIIDSLARGGDPGAPAALSRYAEGRAADHRATVGFTNLLVGAFGIEGVAAGFARGLGIAAFDACAPLRHALCRRMMGLSGRQPRLARGLPPRRMGT